MRVTTRMAIDRFLRDLQLQQRRLFRLQGQASSGIRLERPSDDPVAVERSLRLASEQVEIGRFLDNARDAQDWLAVTEGALQEAEQVLLRARELALRGANATLDDTSRQALADEAQVLFDHLLEISNASYKGRYLFGGTATTNPPFVADPADPDAIAYEGNTHGIERELGAGIHLTINVTGDLFKPMFSVLAALRDQLLAGDQAALGGATLAQLDERLDALIETRSTVGARMQRAELSAQRLEDLQLQVEKLNASLSQVDLAEVLMDLRSTEVTLRAALATGARLIQPTLADYLG